MEQSIRKPVSRRDFLKITAVSGLSAGLGIALGQRWMNTESITTVSESHYLMGTVVNFSIMTQDASYGVGAIQATVNEMKRLVSIFDHRSPDNQLAGLNQSGSTDNPSAELQDIIRKAVAISELTGGAFDITVKPVLDAYHNNLEINPKLLGLVNYRNLDPGENQIHFRQPGMAITLDGIAKGRIVDSGVSVLRALGFESVLVEAGGDLMASTDAVEGKKWRIGVNNPRAPSTVGNVVTFLLENKAVATSGDYINYFSSDFLQNHIIDPRTGKSPSELASATIIAPNATEADALSTSIMVLGVQAGLELVERLPGVEALVVTKERSIFKSTGFPTT